MGQDFNGRYAGRADVEPLPVALVNTYDITLPEPEHLATPTDLERFLDRQGIWRSRSLTGRDLRRACDLREGLRHVFEWADEDTAIQAVNRLLGIVEARPSLAGGPGGWRLVQVPRRDDPIDALHVAAVTELADLIAERGTADLRVCAASPCRDVFVDRSRNRSRRFCCLACANRHRVAEHRHRSRSRSA